MELIIIVGSQLILTSLNCNIFILCYRTQLNAVSLLFFSEPVAKIETNLLSNPSPH